MSKLKLQDATGNIVIKTVDDLKGSKIAIHCEESKISEFMEALEKTGVRWKSGDLPTEWERLLENYNNFKLNKNGRLEYAYDGYYEEMGYEVLEYKGLVPVAKFKVGDRVKLVDVHNAEVNLTSEMRNMLGQIFTIKTYIPEHGQYRVKENTWFWGQSNLELVEDKPVTKILKVWELEEGKEYNEITKHCEDYKFRMYNGELEYELYHSWTIETDMVSLETILSYEFIEIKSQVERDIDKLIEQYGKEEVKRALKRIMIGDEQ